MYLFLSADPSCFCWMDRNNWQTICGRLQLDLLLFYLFMKLVSQADLNVPQFLLYSLLLIYAANSELISCLFYWRFCYSLFMITYFIIDAGWSKIERLSSGLFCYRSQESLMYWSAQGNQNRIAKEITQWMPDYAQLSFFRKLQLCVVSTIQHFTSIPNMIFLLLGFLIACIIISDQRFNLLYKLIGTVPFVISLLLTAYYGWFSILKKHNLNYVLPEVTMKSSSQILMQMILFVLSVIYLICMLISIFYIFRDDTKYGGNNMSKVSVSLVFTLVDWSRVLHYYSLLRCLHLEHVFILFSIWHKYGSYQNYLKK